MVKQYLRCLTASTLLLALSAGHPAWAQKRGGILRLASPDSPANMSILEAATIVAEMPMMGALWRRCSASSVFPNDPVEYRAPFCQPLERADLVSTHQAAVAFDIRCEDCDEASAD
jgi:hypothetical protein